MLKRLKFGKGNAKLANFIGTFSLPAGHTCPAADICLSKAIEKDGTTMIVDGPNTQFRCFAASQENLLPSTRALRWHNFELLKAAKTTEAMATLIKASLPAEVTTVRVHASGDFFNQVYFDAWMQVAREVPELLFYAYTKSINYWVKRIDSIPENFILTASVGGKQDALIESHNLNRAEVVYSPELAEEKGLEIDHDDSHAYSGSKHFALLLHNVQPKGSEASEALAKLKARGLTGYGKGKSYGSKKKKVK